MSQTDTTAPVAPSMPATQPWLRERSTESVVARDHLPGHWEFDYATGKWEFVLTSY